MKKPIIAFDLDDVLADSTEYWRLKINERTGLALESDHYRIPGSYSGYYEQVWKTHKIDHLITIPDIDEQIVSDQSEIRAYSDSLITLNELKSRFTLMIVTARASDQEPETRRWLNKNFPGVFKDIVFADGSTGLKAKNKGQICKEMGALYLVDDSPGHCRDALDNGVGALLFGNYGWHQDIPDGLVRCADWIELGTYFGVSRA